MPFKSVVFNRKLCYNGHMNKVCEIEDCNEPVSGPRARACSKQHSARLSKNRVQKVCLYSKCDEVIFAIPSRAERKKYCSHSCRMKHRYEVEQWDMSKMQEAGRWSDKSPKTNRICNYCNQSYLPRVGYQKWCDSCCPDDESRHRMRRYGISETEYRKMYNDQSGKCFICKTEEIKVVDHCHKTNRVRALLCYKCNGGLGFLENENFVREAMKYIAIFQR